YRDRPDFESLSRFIREALPDGEQREAPPNTDKKVPRRWDGSGHIDPAYRAMLLAERGKRRDGGETRAFLDGARSGDALAEEVGEEAVEAMTSGQDQAAEAFDQVVPEDGGGPFVTTSGSTEFAHGTDESN